MCENGQKFKQILCIQLEYIKLDAKQSFYAEKVTVSVLY